MKQRVIVPSAERQIEEIADFIEADNPTASIRYTRQARTVFFDLPDSVVPVRASDHLSDDIRQLAVPGFAGYALRLLYRGDYIALVAAFRPGLSVSMQDRATGAGVGEFKARYGDA